MKVVTVQHFVCDYCKKEYSDEQSAMRCEAYHLKPKRIEKDMVWSPMKEGNESNRYPKKISIEMEDGSVWVYEKSKVYSRDVSAKREEVKKTVLKKQKGSKNGNDKGE